MKLLERKSIQPLSARMTLPRRASVVLAETPQLIPMVSWGVFFWSFPGKEFDLDGEAAVNAKPHSDKDAAALALAPGRSESSDPKIGLEQVASKELSERGVDRSQGPSAKASGTDFERRQKSLRTY